MSAARKLRPDAESELARDLRRFLVDALGENTDLREFGFWYRPAAKKNPSKPNPTSTPTLSQGDIIPMSRTHRSNARRIRHVDPILEEDLELHPELVPVDEAFSNAHVRVTLDAVIRAHRWQLVATARHHLGNRRQDAEDLVHDLCVEALDGQLALSADPSEALDELLREVIERSRGGT